MGNENGVGKLAQGPLTFVIVRSVACGVDELCDARSGLPNRAGIAKAVSCPST